MKRKVYSGWLACGALALVLGCDNRDGGSPPIMLMDGGSDDGGSSMPPTGCSIDVSTGLPPLPAACLPRCSSATAMAIDTCITSGGTIEQIAMCQQMAVENDTTPPTTLTIVGEETETEQLNCSGCWEYALQHCLFASCGAELVGCLSCSEGCDPEMAGCEAEETALNTCLTNNQDAIQACFDEQAGRCLTG